MKLIMTTRGNKLKRKVLGKKYCLRGINWKIVQFMIHFVSKFPNVRQPCLINNSYHDSNFNNRGLFELPHQISHNFQQLQNCLSHSFLRPRTNEMLAFFAEVEKMQIEKLV